MTVLAAHVYLETPLRAPMEKIAVLLGNTPYHSAVAFGLIWALLFIAARVMLPTVQSRKCLAFDRLKI